MIGWICITIWVWVYGCCRGNNGETWRFRPSDIVSPRWDLQKQARFVLELSLRRRALVWARWHLAQARGARLSENAWEPWYVTALLPQARNLTFGRELAKSPRVTVAVSPKRESTAWARALLSPKRGLPTWAKPSSGSCYFPYMNIVGCLIGWFDWF